MNAEQNSSIPHSPLVRQGMALTPQGASVIVAPGECEIGGRTVKVKKAVVLKVAPAPVLSATDEPVKLSVDKPQGWSKGTRLKGPDARDVTAFGSMVRDSLQIRRAPGGELLKEGEDYLVDWDWAHVGLGPQSQVTAQDTVYASYRYSQERMDTIQVAPNGVVSLKAGKPHISAPVPPEADPGCLALAHVFMPHQATTVKPEQIFVILESEEQAVTLTTPGRIPKTLAKLKAGQPVKIVCWGDSVTAGGNASRPETRYPDVFAAGLRERFPQAQITMENISIGGSNSHQWLYLPPEKLPANWQQTCRFQRVLDANPDLVTIEFVNDAGLDRNGVEQTYGDILNRITGIGAEVILITPHFTMLQMMSFKDVYGKEGRPYVLALRDFSEKHHVALADASSRWEHLWKEGIPYLTLLDNTINHPDDRGHRLFAEELWKCFK
ncbi:MAG TPA: GDSL-type esterase/lipase family protein [Armatimonadota bacterium]|nr:GDSL-type esterase/lipase family protein [Armatimonadota bacterium]